MEEDYAYPRSKRLVSDQTSSTLSTGPSSDANPAAEMLQDMIREKRAKSQRTKKTFDPASRLASGDNLELKETQSSPVTSLSSRGRPSMTARRASGVNGKPTVQKEMGLREMSEHISKVDKQNFDLKLEVFHRRQRNDALEARIQKLEENEADFENLQATYTALLLESDRDRLVLDDAVAQICELQAENEELKAALGGRLAGIFDQEAGDQATEQISATNRHEDIPITPPQAVRDVSRPSKNVCQNLVMSSQSSTSRGNALEVPVFSRNRKSEAGFNSLYSSGDSMIQANASALSLNRAGSVFNGEDEDIVADRQMLHSPRLSILSESGFSSIYGSPHDHTETATRANEGEDDSSSQPSSEVQSGYPRHIAQLDERVDLWIQESPVAPRSGKRSPKQTKATPNKQYTSIEEVLSKRPVRLGDESNVPHVQIPPRQSSSAERTNHGQRRLERKSPPKSPSQKPRSYSSSNGSLIFGGKMPPTPDTMSTTTIGGPSSSTQSIIAEKSLLDHSGPPSKGYVNLVNYGRPRTSDSDAFYPTAHRLPDIPKGLDHEGDTSAKPSYQNEDDPLSTAEDHGDSAFVDDPVNSAKFVAQRNARPALTSYQTDMMFNGDGFALVQPSRTISYPSPRHRVEATSAQLPYNSPTKGRKQRSAESSEVGARDTTSGITEHAKEATGTRMKDIVGKGLSSSTRNQHSGEENALPPLSANQQPGEVPRSRFGRFQFFKRTNSQNAGSKSISQATSPRRPRTVRSHSSTRAQPSSLKPQISSGSRPGTSDGPAPTTMPRPLQSSTSRRHSAILDHAASFLPGGTASKDHSRHLSETRPPLRSEDSNSKWPLGRNTSAKIKEGFGLKRT